ncbi:MAG TPA: DUF2252 domain-containing protein [Terriglobales bacterium]|nr:DUF2252 domain-containing protein [Terriglobales bacterium]
MPDSPFRMPAREERLRYGKSLREKVTRASQANWDRTQRKVPFLELLRESERGRLENLLPYKAARMAVSPFGFYRGAVPVMACDLSTLPNTGIYAQLCGDAHVHNLGAFEGQDGRLIFDINDFDESLRGPWEWDVKRMAGSLVLAGRESSNSEKECKIATLAFVESYREAMRQFSKMPVVDLARYQVFRHLDVSPVHNVLRKAERATPAHNLEQLAEHRNGKWRFRDNKPLRFHVPPATVKLVVSGLLNYIDTLLPERQHWFTRYRVEDVAFRVVGTGSIGVRDYIVLMFGTVKNDPLFVQIKEEGLSAYTRYLPKAEVFPNQGQRVALGQRSMQVQSDIFLGWTSIAGRDYLVRQLRDHKAGIEDGDLKGEGLVQYAQVCGELLAKGHARTGDPYAIAGYIGNSDKFDKAIAGFGVAYADQNTKDFEEFIRAIQTGRIQAAKLPPPKPAKSAKGKRAA